MNGLLYEQNASSTSRHQVNKVQRQTILSGGTPFTLTSSWGGVGGKGGTWGGGGGGQVNGLLYEQNASDIS